MCKIGHCRPMLGQLNINIIAYLNQPNSLVRFVYRFKLNTKLLVCPPEDDEGDVNIE